MHFRMPSRCFGIRSPLRASPLQGSRTMIHRIKLLSTDDQHQSTISFSLSPFTMVIHFWFHLSTWPPLPLGSSTSVQRCAKFWWQKPTAHGLSDLISCCSMLCQDSRGQKHCFRIISQQFVGENGQLPQVETRTFLLLVVDIQRCQFRH